MLFDLLRTADKHVCMGYVAFCADKYQCKLTQTQCHKIDLIQGFPHIEKFSSALCVSVSALFCI